MPDMRFLEDLVVGSVIELGSVVVDRDELIAFARRFDPQAIHIDEVAAATLPFGGLIASGWHTGSMFMRLYADAFLSQVAILGGLGIDDMHLPRPVRPGDELHGTVEIVEARPSELKPDRGTLVTKGTMRNQDQEVVMTLRPIARIARRPQPAERAGGAGDMDRQR
jgi:acyl dehydratase